MMRFKYFIALLLSALGANIYAAPKPVDLDFIELIGEMGDDQDDLEIALSELEAQQPKPVKPASDNMPSGGQSK